MSVQELARSLVSAGSIKLPGDEGEGIYVLSVRDGDLVEKYWVGESVEDENVIASGVRNDTSASYLPSSEQMPRLVIFIDQENSVRCYAYEEDMEEWEETPLGDKWNITTSPKSKLSAIMGPEGEMVVSYQDETDHLAVIMSAGENEWTSFGPLEGDPIVGTPQCLEIINNKLHLFYVEKGSGIGYLVFNSSTGSWKASVLENTKFNTVIDNFIVAEDPETSSLQSYFLTDGSLWNVSGGKEKTFLGEVNDDAMGNDKQQDFTDFDLENFQVPVQYWHPTQQRDDTCMAERFGTDLSTPARRWENWVVKLTFEKLGSEKHGNGFYVNVPNAAYDVILTAGHNLVDKPEHYCSNIKIVQDPSEEKDIDVKPEMIRVCRKYFEDPDELKEIYDYGAILLRRPSPKRHRGFGFHLMLGLPPQLGKGAAYTEDEDKDILRGEKVNVCGYTPEDSPPDKSNPNNSPRKSEGRCIGTNLHQLRYDADTKPGMSGGPVWVGFRGVETIVAIQ
ncbi:cytochrome c oxidase assembly protein [Daldinia childiae]|uniref:cytochrome c oxidase assembly protein n=1 Tax=Daldinia childiae TaxID=326645 RepID=UPI0014484BE0|nr:cytochrome c oxidase assembly protein [Daldinia childiae]KAF3059215.1 cytochrome c oxidase assembly protein [Daldinia childiae]